MTKRVWNVIFIGSVCLAVVVACCSSFVYFRTSNNVWVSITNLPEGTKFVSVAYDKGSQLHSMNAVSGRPLGTIMHPANWIWSYQTYERPGNPSVHDWEATVEWRDGDRYGAVTCDENGIWRVAWFAPNVRQENSATFDLSQGMSVPLTEKQVTELELGKVLQNIREYQRALGK
jgi:hypothetical protein